MSNNKQQTEINAVEYIDKVNQFAKENNTDKPKQQTAVEWLIGKLQTQDGTYRGFCNIGITHEKLIKQAKEMEKEQHIKSWDSALEALGLDEWEDFEQYYNETYGGNK